MGWKQRLAIAPVKTTHSRLFQVTTIDLLLVAVLAHEGGAHLLDMLDLR